MANSSGPGRPLFETPNRAIPGRWEQSNSDGQETFGVTKRAAAIFHLRIGLLNFAGL